MAQTADVSSTMGEEEEQIEIVNVEWEQQAYPIFPIARIASMNGTRSLLPKSNMLSAMLSTGRSSLASTKSTHSSSKSSAASTKSTHSSRSKSSASSRRPPKPRPLSSDNSIIANTSYSSHLPDTTLSTSGSRSLKSSTTTPSSAESEKPAALQSVENTDIEPTPTHATRNSSTCIARNKMTFLIKPELLSPKVTAFSICSSFSSSKGSLKKMQYPIIKLALEETREKGPFRRIDWDVNDKNNTKGAVKQESDDCNTPTSNQSNEGNSNFKFNNNQVKTNRNKNYMEMDDDEAFGELRMRAIELKTGKPSSRHETLRYNVSFTYIDKEGEDCVIMSAEDVRGALLEYEGHETIKLVAKVEARPEMIISTSEFSSGNNDVTFEHFNVQQPKHWQQLYHHQQTPHHHLRADSSESTPTWSNMTSAMRQPFSPHSTGTRSQSTNKTRKHASFDQSTRASPTSMVPVDHQKIIKRAVKLLRTKSVPIEQLLATLSSSSSTEIPSMPPGAIVSNNKDIDDHAIRYQNHRPDSDKRKSYNIRKNRNSNNKDHRHTSFNHREPTNVSLKKHPVSILRRPKELREVLLPMSQEPQQQQQQEQNSTTEALIVRQQHRQQQKQQKQLQQQQNRRHTMHQQMTSPPIDRIVNVSPPPVQNVYSDSTAEISAITYTPFRTMLFGCGGGSR